MNRKGDHCENPKFIIIDDCRKNIDEDAPRHIVVCACDDVIYIDTYRKLPSEDCIEDKLLSKKTTISKSFFAMEDLKELCAHNDEVQNVVKQVPSLKGLKIGLSKIPHLILYNEKDPDNKIKLRTRTDNNDKHLMDYLFSSSMHDEGNGVCSVNITIITYESELHHCLTYYKIKFT